MNDTNDANDVNPKMPHHYYYHRGSIMLGGRSSMMGGRSSMMGGRNSMMGGGRQSMLKSRGRRSTAKITLPGPSSTTASSVRESSFVVIHVWWYSPFAMYRPGKDRCLDHFWESI